MTTILFDLGGVLAHWRPERRLAALAAASPLSTAEIQARIWDSGFDAACDRGEHLDPHAIYVHLQQTIGLRLNYVETLDAWASAFELDLDVLTIAARLKARYRVGALTNNGPLTQAALAQCQPELLTRFDPFCLAYQFRATKPDPALYAAVERRLSLPGAALLLIDDSQANVDGAIAAGWSAWRFTTAAALAEPAALLIPGPDERPWSRRDPGDERSGSGRP